MEEKIYENINAAKDDIYNLNIAIKTLNNTVSAYKADRDYYYKAYSEARDIIAIQEDEISKIKSTHTLQEELKQARASDLENRKIIEDLANKNKRLHSIINDIRMRIMGI